MRFCPFCSAENADELAVCQACGRRLPPLPPRRGARNAPPTGVSLPPRPASPTKSPAADGPRTSSFGPRADNTIPTGSQPGVDPQTVPTGPQAAMPTGPQAAMPPTGPQASIPTGPQIGLPPGGATPPSGAYPAMPTGPQVALPPTGPQVGLPSGQHGALPPTGPHGALPPTGSQRAQRPTGPQSPQPEARSPRSEAPSANRQPLGPSPNPYGAPGSTAPGVAAPGSANAELLNAISPGPAAERAAPPTESRIIADRRGRNESKPPPLSPTALARPKSPSVPPPTGGLATGPNATMIGPAAGPTGGTPGSGAYAPPEARGPRPEALPQGVPAPVATPPSGPNARPPLPPMVRRTMPGVGRADDAPLVDPEFVQEEGGPPPTRIQRPEPADRPFTPPRVLPVPEVPEPGLVNAARYTYQFARARWQRGGARKQLALDIKQDTEALDQVLGALGRAARGARVDGRVFSAENAAISEAEGRIGQFQHDHAEVEARKAEENSKFIEVERERNEKLVEAERLLDEAQRELSHLEGQRRALRDKRKEIERRQKAYLKAAEDNDRQSSTTQLGDQRQELRRAAEGNRKEAAALEPERQEIDRRLGGLERPISEATAKLDAAKAELDAAKRSLNDAREGHSHRLDELDAEQKRKGREIALAEGEIARRLVTLGTLVNLNRIEDPRFGELYDRIDRLRSAITARTTEIERLTAEREAYDRGTLVRGIATIGGAFVLLIALIVILLAII